MRKEENDLIHRGTYDGTIYHNPANKFCIISVKTTDKDVPQEARSTRRHKDHLIRFVATGYELPRTDAVELELDGEWKKGKYGMQLQVEQWHEIVPKTTSGVEGYLSSGLSKASGRRSPSRSYRASVWRHWTFCKITRSGCWRSRSSRSIRWRTSRPHMRRVGCCKT